MAKKIKRPVPDTLFGIQYPEEVRILWRNVHGNRLHELAIDSAYKKHFPGDREKDLVKKEKKLRERVNHFTCDCPGSETVRDLAQALKLSTYYLEV